jgi:hypothetical protein
LHPTTVVERTYLQNACPVRMKILLMLFSGYLGLLCGCSFSDSSEADNRDYAVETCYPAPNEIQIAEQRARDYWQKNGSRVGPEPHYLVVAASSMLAAELNAEFSIKLDHSATSAAYFTQGISSSSKQGVQGYLIFDTETGRAVSPQGYIIIDTPPRGQIVRVAQYTARYIGSGG